MRPAVFMFAAALAAAAVAQTTAPADLRTTVAQLDDRDPDVRATARSTLMLLSRDDLPRLRDAVAGSAPNVTRRAALRDAVTHVFLTGKHNFRGRGNGFLGIQPVGARGEPPTIRARTIGYDAYRALMNGDAIVALRGPRGGAPFAAVASLDELKAHLADARVGDWVRVRVLRDGRPVEVDVRVGPYSKAIEDVLGANPALPEAEAYWQRDFAPALDAPTTTMATTRPA